MCHHCWRTARHENCYSSGQVYALGLLPGLPTGSAPHAMQIRGSSQTHHAQALASSSFPYRPKPKQGSPEMCRTELFDETPNARPSEAPRGAVHKQGPLPAVYNILAEVSKCLAAAKALVSHVASAIYYCPLLPAPVQPPANMRQAKRSYK